MNKETVKEKHEIDLLIDHVQLEPGQQPPKVSFEKTSKVGDAAMLAAIHLGYSPQGTYTFAYKGETLDRNRPLVSYGLKDGDLVVLTDIGRAV